MRFVFLQNIVFKDLDKKQLKVVDFGFAKQLPCDEALLTMEYNSQGTNPGTEKYLSPELHKGDVAEVSKKARDIWAFGIVAFEIITRQHPPKPW